MNSSRLSIIKNLVGDNYTDHGNDEVSIDCPNCKLHGDTHTDRKLYINLKTGAYWCHRCHYTGYLKLDEIFVSETINPFEILNTMISKSEESEEEEYIKIPKNLAINDRYVTSKLLERNLSEEDIEYYSIRVPNLLSNDKEESRLFGRFVIPNKVINRNWTDTYVARSYINSPKRYLNPTRVKSHDIVFNLHNIEKDIDTIIINEGVINSIIAGKNSVATFGKYVSNIQLKSILDKNPKEIILSLDRDAIDMSYQLARKIFSIKPIKVKVLELPMKVDASDLGRERYHKLIKETEYYNEEFRVNKLLNSIIS